MPASIKGDIQYRSSVGVHKEPSSRRFDNSFWGRQLCYPENHCYSRMLGKVDIDLSQSLQGKLLSAFRQYSDFSMNRG